MSREQKCQKLRSGIFGIPASGFLLPDGKEIWIGLNYYGSDLGRTFGSKRECLSAIAASVEVALREIAFEKALEHIKVVAAKHAADHCVNTERYFDYIRAALQEFYDNRDAFLKAWSDDAFLDSKLEAAIDKFLQKYVQHTSDFAPESSYAIVLRATEAGEQLIALSRDGEQEEYWFTDDLDDHPMLVEAENRDDAVQHFPYKRPGNWEYR